VREANQPAPAVQTEYLMPCVIGLFFLLSVLLIGSCSRTPDSVSNPETYFIGLVLPAEQQSNEPVLRGLDLFLKHYNVKIKHQLAREFRTAAPKIAFRTVAARGLEKLRGVPYEKAATDMAQLLIQQQNSVALLGNPSADNEHVDHKFYNDNNVPLIALASSETDVTRKSPWVFSMIYSDEWQGALISAYAKEILGFAQVLVVRGDYMSGLSDSFVLHSGNNGLNIVANIVFSPDKDLAQDGLTRRVQEVQDRYDAVILLAHADHAVEIVRQLSSTNVSVPILGPDDLAGPGFVTGVKNLPSHKVPERIIVANPFFFELAPLKASEFVQEYGHLYRGEQPSQSSVYAYDAAYLITRGLMDGLRQGKTKTSELRESIKDYLLSINSMDVAVEGISGKLYFSRDGAMRRPALFSRLKDGLFFPEYTQLLPLRRLPPKNTHEVESAVDEESRLGAIPVDGVLMKKVAVVYAGIDVEQISNINLETQQFDMQGFLWMKWRSNIPWNERHKFFWNDVLSSGEDFVPLGKDLKSPTKYVSYKLRTRFSADYDLRQFPFDTQVLTLDLSAAKVGVDDTLFVVDRVHLRTREDLMSSKKVLPPGYKLLGIDHFSGTKPSGSSLGKVKLSHEGPDYSIYQVSLTVQRLPFPYFLKVFLPLFILLGVSLAVFLVPVQGSFQVRMSLAATALLSAIVLHLAWTQSVPNVGYLARIDYYFLFAYLFTATVIVVSIYKEQLSRSGALHVAVAVNRAVGLTLLFGVVVVFGCLSVPGISEIWPAFVATVTILAAFAWCGYLIYSRRQATPGESLLIDTEEGE
jgi:ABC-type branched-subunit amino acid transport system substrate-binding protein